MSVITIDRSTRFDPGLFFPDPYTIDEEDARSLALASIDLAHVRLVSMLKTDERAVDSEEWRRRLTDGGHVALDARVLQVLSKNKERIPKSWRRKRHGETPRIFFDGTVLRDLRGQRCVPMLFWRDEGGYRISWWDWCIHRCSNPRFDLFFSAVLAQ